MSSTTNPADLARDQSEKASPSWPIYEKDRTGDDNSLEQWCDIAWGASVIPTGEARVELVLEFMRHWYRNTDYDWRSFYADIASRSELFPDMEELEQFIQMPPLPETVDLDRFFDLLDRLDELQETEAPLDQAVVEITSCGIDARTTSDPVRLSINSVIIDSETTTGFPSSLEILETVGSMQSCQLRRLPEEANDEVRIENLKSRILRNSNPFKNKSNP